MSRVAGPVGVDRLGVLCLLVAALGWGVNWPLFKLLLREWPPLFARGTAGIAAATALFLYAAWRGEKLLPPRASAPRLVWLSVTNVFAYMGFSAIALLWLTPGEGALLVYTTPIWVTLIAWPLRGTKPTYRAAFALMLCLAGTLTLFGDSLATLDASKLPGVALSLAAAALLALGAVTAGEGLPMAPLVSTVWQILIGSILILALSCLTEHTVPAALSLSGFGRWAFMAMGPMGVCYLAWFGAVRRLSPSTAVSGSLLVPAIGVVASYPILGTPITIKEMLALALILSGIVLVLRESNKERARYNFTAES